LVSRAGCTAENHPRSLRQSLRGAGATRRPDPALGTVPGIGAAAPREDSPVKSSKGLRLLQGVPITLAIAASFAIVFVTTPVRRVLAMARRHIDGADTADRRCPRIRRRCQLVAVTLTRYGFEVWPAKPGWWMTAPLHILAKLGGPSFRDYVPHRLACFRGPRLEVVLHTSGLSLRGSEQDTAWAHGLLVEALTDAPAYQTFAPGAQDIERQIRSVWAVIRQNPAAYEGAPRLEARLQEIAREIRELPVGYEEWQIVYRQALQLGRAMRGEPQLLSATVMDHTSEVDESIQEVDMKAALPPRDPTRDLSLRELITGITEKITLLAKKEAELATTEVKADLGSELSTAKGLAIAVLAGILGLNMLLVALVLTLATVMPGWLAAALIGAGLLVIGGIVGYVSWTGRVTSPLSVTRKTIKETAQWAKERLA
jgi:hypothetical protein